MLEEEDGIFTCVETIDEGDYFGFNIKRAKGTTEMKFADSASYLKPIGHNKT